MRVSTLKAAFKAYVFNKLSDICIFLAFIISFIVNIDLNILYKLTLLKYSTQTIFVFTDVNAYLFEIIVVLLMCSAFIKSAQFGFHV